MRTLAFIWFLVAFALYLISLKYWYAYINSPTLLFDPNMDWRSWLHIGGLYTYPLLLAVSLYYGYHFYTEDKLALSSIILLIPFIIVYLTFSLGLI